MNNDLLSLDQRLNKVEELHKDGLGTADIVRRAKTETSDSGLMRHRIEEERFLVMHPLNKFIGQSKSFTQTATVIVLGFVAGYILWLFLESLIWQSGLVGLLVIVIGCQVLAAFLASRHLDDRILNIVNGAYIDGAEYETVNHYAEAYKKALDEIDKL